MLYTRKGDGGNSGLFDEKRSPKDSARFEALGTVDELNAALGICRAFAQERGDLGVVLAEKDFTSICEELQQHLFIVQAELAGSDKRMEEMHVRRLEEITDHIEKALPPIKSFFLPGASPLAAHFDQARTVARRAERRLTAFGETEEVRPPLRAYLNRFSSVLYALARLAGAREGGSEKAPSY